MKYIVSLIVMSCALVASVDINNAGVKTLTNLKGVGPIKADKIVSYRDNHGCFSSIEGLSKVKGIGPKTIEKNKADIVLGRCKK